MLKRRFVNVLKTIKIFAEFNEVQLAILADVVEPRIMKKGAHIFFKGEMMHYIYFIESGVVKIYENDYSGREQIINILTKGEMFPHRGIFEKGKYPANAVIYEDAQLLCVDVIDFWQLLIESPEISMTIMKMQNKMIADLQLRLNEKMMHDTREQIIKLLLRLTESHGIDIGNQHYKLILAFTNQELANMIGTSRETINRTLTNFKKQNFIYNDEDGKLVIDYRLIRSEILY